MSKLKDQLTAQQEADRLRDKRVLDERKRKTGYLDEIHNQLLQSESKLQAVQKELFGEVKEQLQHPGPIAMYNLSRGKHKKTEKKGDTK